MLSSDMERLNLTISKENMNKLQKIADLEHRTRSGQVVWLIEKYSEICNCYYCTDRQNCKKIKNLMNGNQKKS